MYNKVADPGDMVIEKRGFSIVDTHESGIAIHVSLWFQMVKAYSHRNKIFLVTRHRGVRRFLLPGLHHIHHVSQQSLQDVAQWKAYVDFAWSVSSESDDDSLPLASPQNSDLVGSG